jgi:hypothetical protein
VFGDLEDGALKQAHATTDRLLLAAAHPPHSRGLECTLASLYISWAGTQQGVAHEVIYHAIHDAWCCVTMQYEGGITPERAHLFVPFAELSGEQRVKDEVWVHAVVNMRVVDDTPAGPGDVGKDGDKEEKKEEGGAVLGEDIDMSVVCDDDERSLETEASDYRCVRLTPYKHTTHMTHHSKTHAWHTHDTHAANALQTRTPHPHPQRRLGEFRWAGPAHSTWSIRRTRAVPRPRRRLPAAANIAASVATKVAAARTRDGG